MLRITKTEKAGTAAVETGRQPDRELTAEEREARERRFNEALEALRSAVARAKEFMSEKRTESRAPFDYNGIQAALDKAETGNGFQTLQNTTEREIERELALCLQEVERAYKRLCDEGSADGKP